MANSNEIIDYLDDQLEVSTIDDFCPNGLQLQGKEERVDLIATAVSASLETIKQAIALKPQILIVHHGIFWKSDTRRIKGTQREKIKLLLDHDISLLGYHLPLDCHKQWGNNYKAAQDLGWKNLQGFGKRCGNAHIGVMGEIEPQDIQHFQKQLENYYGHPAHTALGGPKKIEKVALISGGAHWEINEAIRQNVDAFITGSFDEPIWHIAFEEKINFLAMGHSNTEKIGPKALGEHLSQKYQIEHKFIDIENPF